MAKDFEKDLNDLIKGHQDNEEPGARSAMVSQLRAAAEQVSKSEPWPGEIKAAEKAALPPVVEEEDNAKKDKATKK